MAIIVQSMSMRDFDVLPGVGSPVSLIEYNTGAGNPVNAYPITSILFPDSALTAAYWTFATGVIGGTPALTVLLDWFAVNPLAVTGNVAWSVQVGVLPNGSTGTDVYAGALTTATTGTTAVNT